MHVPQELDVLSIVFIYETGQFFFISILLKRKKERYFFIAKKDLRPKGADNTNNTEDNHQTDIFNTYHIYS